MKLRSIAFYSLAAMVLVAVIGIVHRHVGRLAPAPPVDVSNIAEPVAPIPLPTVTPPTILQSQADDSELPRDLDNALARRPDAAGGDTTGPNVPESLPDLLPSDTLPVPIPQNDR